MKTIGLIGGMSWESTLPYYRLINEGVRARLGGLHSARLILFSVDFAEIEGWQATGEWARAGAHLADIARTLEAAGADLIVLATNTMHKVADDIEAAIAIPLLHIADTTAAALHTAGIERVGLLGTRFTMEEGFYRDRLAGAGIVVSVPDAADRAEVHRIIYDELCQGKILAASQAALCQIARHLIEDGAQGIVLGCTELGLLLTRDALAAPLFDTLEIHAEAAVAAALAE